jgi:hypothetical protein
MIQAVAHFYDLQRAFRVAADAVRENGYWLIETWNKDSFVARTLGENWHEYSPPSVLHYFSPATLGTLAAQFGFREVARGRPPKRLSGKHAKSLMGYKLGDSGRDRLLSWGLKFVPDRIRILYPNFDLFWALYRKQDR